MYPCMYAVVYKLQYCFIGERAHCRTTIILPYEGRRGNRQGTSVEIFDEVRIKGHLSPYPYYNIFLSQAPIALSRAPIALSRAPVIPSTAPIVPSRAPMSPVEPQSVAPIHQFLGGAKIFYDVEIFLRSHAKNSISSPLKLRSIHVLNGTKAWYACTYWTLNQ